VLVTTRVELVVRCGERYSAQRREDGETRKSVNIPRRVGQVLAVFLYAFAASRNRACVPRAVRERSGSFRIVFAYTTALPIMSYQRQDLKRTPDCMGSSAENQPVPVGLFVERMGRRANR
jgi:hypothetical protein